MPPHLTPAMDPLLRQSLEALGLPIVVPEPEVSRAAVRSVQCKSLASVIEALIADHEPMLRAERDGATVTVREIGGSALMRFTVEPGK
jgi:predicted component of type VI protein secretion system